MMSGQMGGQMNLNANAHEEALFQPYSTLDEPVLDTIMRDVRAVVSKLKVVMLPLDRTVRVGVYTVCASRAFSSKLCFSLSLNILPICSPILFVVTVDLRNRSTVTMELLQQKNQK